MGARGTRSPHAKEAPSGPPAGRRWRQCRPCASHARCRGRDRGNRIRSRRPASRTPPLRPGRPPSRARGRRRARLPDAGAPAFRPRGRGSLRRALTFGSKAGVVARRRLSSDSGTPAQGRHPGIEHDPRDVRSRRRDATSRLADRVVGRPGPLEQGRGERSESPVARRDCTPVPRFASSPTVGPSVVVSDRASFLRVATHGGESVDPFSGAAGYTRYARQMRSSSSPERAKSHGRTFEPGTSVH